MGSEHSHLLTEDQREELQAKWSKDILEKAQADAFEVFRTLDTSGSRKLSPAQFSKVLGVLGAQNSPLSNFLFHALDKNQDGFVDFYDFFNWMLISTAGSMEDRLKFGFRLMDLTGNGEVTKEELHQTVQSLLFILTNLKLETPHISEYVDDLWRRLDVEAKGTITCDEYTERCKQGFGSSDMNTQASCTRSMKLGNAVFFGQKKFNFMLSVMLGLQLTVEKTREVTEEIEILSDDDDGDANEQDSDLWDDSAKSHGSPTTRESVRPVDTVESILTIGVGAEQDTGATRQGSARDIGGLDIIDENQETGDIEEEAADPSSAISERPGEALTADGLADIDSSNTSSSSSSSSRSTICSLDRGSTYSSQEVVANILDRKDATLRARIAISNTRERICSPPQAPFSDGDSVRDNLDIEGSEDSDCTNMHRSLTSSSLQVKFGPEAGSDDECLQRRCNSLDGFTIYNKSGYLFKKGNGASFLGRRNWKRRYFVVEENLLKYYASREGTKEGMRSKGVVLLSGCQVRCLQYSKHHHHFQVWHPERGVLDLRASSAKEMRDWMSTLQAAAKMPENPETAKISQEAEPKPLSPFPGHRRNNTMPMFKGRRMSQMTYELIKGSNHKITSFAPHLFRQIRSTFGIGDDAYLLSLGLTQLMGSLLMGDLGCLSEQVSEGKSGSFFYYSADGKFMVKTISKLESDTLKAIVPSYHSYVVTNKDTLLTRLYGLYKLMLGRDEYHFVVMGNVFNTTLPIHERYDLKGSTLGRTVGERNLHKPGVVYKDLDITKLNRRLNVGPTYASKLKHQIQQDAEFLSRNGIIDYSLLVGVHHKNKDQSSESSEGSKGSRPGLSSDETPVVDEIISMFQRDGGGMQSHSEAVDGPEMEDKVFFVGIIDTLISFRWRKKSEYALKHKLHTEDSFSVVPPGEYGKRFTDFVLNLIE